jgi:antitoxin FitA
VISLISFQALEVDVASILVRKLSEETKQRMRMRAAANGRSLEAEVRAVIEEKAQSEVPRPFFAPGEKTGSRLSGLFKDVDMSEVVANIEEARRTDVWSRRDPVTYFTDPGNEGSPVEDSDTESRGS